MILYQVTKQALEQILAVQHIISNFIYQKRRNGSETKSFIASKVSVTQESSQQSTKVASAIENIDNISCCNRFHVEDSSEVNQEI